MNRKFLLINIRGVIRRCYIEKGVLKSFAKIYRNTPVLEFLFNNVVGEACNFI